MRTPNRIRAALQTRQAARGFTLVEVLVALTIMAVLAGLAWRGLDGMLRAREGTRTALDGTVRINTIITQWEQDLMAVYGESTGSSVVPTITFDGQTLRLVRRTDGGVRLVAWSLRSGTWLRWTSPVVTRIGELQENWMRSQQLLGTEAEQLKLLDGVTEWQLYFYRGTAWTNAQSSGDMTAPDAGAIQREALPDGVRLVLKLGDRTLTRDIALGS